MNLKRLYILILVLFVSSPLLAQPSILLVDDFSSSYDWKTLWQQDLSVMGYEVEVVPVAEADAAKLSGADVVLWNCGNSTSNILDSTNQVALSAYLTGGGNLLLVGSCIPADLISHGNRSWLMDRLGCDYVMPNSTITWSSTYLGMGFEGVQGSILEGLSSDLTFGDGAAVAADNLNLIHETDERSNHLVRLNEVPGYLGVARQTPTDRTMLLTFPLESVESASTRQAILKRCIDWLLSTRYEGRGIWIVRDRMTSPENIDSFVDACANANFNALFVQVRGRGDAYYHSATEPRASELSGQPPEFDPLQYCIDQAHARGLQVHAWLNSGYAWGTGSLPTEASHVLNLHPEYVMVNRSGKSLMDYTSGEFSSQYAEGRYLSLGAPAVQDYLTGVFLEVVENYEVDGVHFDFIRSPARGVNEDYDLDYNPLAIAAFESEQGFDPHAVEVDSEAFLLWLEWQRQQIGKLVGRIRSEAHLQRPGIRVSAAVLSRYHLARHQATQDWIDWLQKGQLDSACIMSYGSDNNLVVQEGLLAQENRGLGTAWVGMGANHDIELIIDRIEKVRRTVVPEGLLFFSYSSLNETELNELKNRPFVAPAEVPPVNTGMPGDRPAWSTY